MTSPLSHEEMRNLQEAKELGDLRKLAAFNKLMLVGNAAVEAARDQVLYNPDPRMKDALVAEYRAFHKLMRFFNEYIDGVINKRRDVVAELLRSVGISEDVIANNLDSSLDFLMPQDLNGGPNARTK
jgi:hypothetical protein